MPAFSSALIIHAPSDHHQTPVNRHHATFVMGVWIVLPASKTSPDRRGIVLAQGLITAYILKRTGQPIERMFAQD